MAEIIISLLISIIAFIFGCFLLYKLSKDQKKWDEFWENQNKQNPLAPKSWPGSDTSRLLSYILPFAFFLGGFLAMISSFLKLLFFLF